VKVPGAESAVVPENKIRRYLLSSTHLEGRAKARFFALFGFSSEDWTLLATALKAHVAQNDAVLSKSNEYGSFYNVDGPLISPDGRNPTIRSVWLVGVAGSTPQLITAHPLYP
jgi:hypothetical protein